MQLRHSIISLLAATTFISTPSFADSPPAEVAKDIDKSTAPVTSPTSTESVTAPAVTDSKTTGAATDSATSDAAKVDSANSDSAATRKPTPGLNPPASAKSLQGNIQGGAPVVLQGLHDVGVSVHHLQEMLKGLLYEAQRQDMVVVAEPEVIGPIVMPAIPGPSGMLSMGLLPPRKKWVDYFMAQIEEIIPMLDHEINSLPRPDGSDSELQQAYIEMFDAARGFNPPWADLENSTQGPKYKNADISAAGSQLWYQVNKFNKLKNKLFKMVKEDAKQKKKKEG